MKNYSGLSSWFDSGKESGKRFMIIVKDEELHFSIFPIYRDTLEEVRMVLAVPPIGSTIREVYDLEADKDEQLAEHKTMRV